MNLYVFLADFVMNPGHTNSFGKTALQLMCIFWSWQKAHIAFLSINDCSNIYARIFATNNYNFDKLFVSNLCLQLVCFQIVGESEVLLIWSFWGNILWSSYELLMVCFDKNIGYLFHFFKSNLLFYQVRSIWPFGRRANHKESNILQRTSNHGCWCLEWGIDEECIWKAFLTLCFSHKTSKGMSTWNNMLVFCQLSASSCIFHMYAGCLIGNHVSRIVGWNTLMCNWM